MNKELLKQFTDVSERLKFIDTQLSNMLNVNMDYVNCDDDYVDNNFFLFSSLKYRFALDYISDILSNLQIKEGDLDALQQLLESFKDYMEVRYKKEISTPNSNSIYFHKPRIFEVNLYKTKLDKYTILIIELDTSKGIISIPSIIKKEKPY